MVDANDNLLSALHGWVSQQDENFTTESFTYLLRWLLQNEPAAGITLVNWLTDGRLELTVTDSKSVSVSTQVSLSLGRPDLVLRTADTLAYIEAKVESGLGERQLQRYLTELEKSLATKKALVLLSRYPEAVDSEIEEKVVCRRWFQLALCLNELSQRCQIQGAVSHYLIDQFVGFLRERGMTMERVGWELTSGVKAYRNLIEMLREAASSLNWKPVSSQGWDWIGYYLESTASNGSKSRSYWVGYIYKSPDRLSFQTNNIEVSHEAADLVGKGAVIESRDCPGGYKWTHELVLDSEDVHFFALSRARQMQTLEQFLAESLAAARLVQKDASPPAV